MYLVTEYDFGIRDEQLVSLKTKFENWFNRERGVYARKPFAVGMPSNKIKLEGLKFDGKCIYNPNDHPVWSDIHFLVYEPNNQLDQEILGKVDLEDLAKILIYAENKNQYNIWYLCTDDNKVKKIDFSKYNFEEKF